jgi:hypothetical protein
MSKQVGMSVAVGLVGVGVILNALPKFGVGAATANAAPVAQAGAPAPTIVWYGSESPAWSIHILFRAWSDGTVELRYIQPVQGQDWCQMTTPPCHSPWFVVASPDEGLSAAADSNFDAVVDGADLANLLAAWGPAPRSPIPPSDCPLDLVNP